MSSCHCHIRPCRCRPPHARQTDEPYKPWRGEFDNRSEGTSPIVCYRIDPNTGIPFAIVPGSGLPGVGNTSNAGLPGFSTSPASEDPPPIPGQDDGDGGGGERYGISGPGSVTIKCGSQSTAYDFTVYPVDGAPNVKVEWSSGQSFPGVVTIRDALGNVIGPCTQLTPSVAGQPLFATIVSNPGCRVPGYPNTQAPYGDYMARIDVAQIASPYNCNRVPVSTGYLDVTISVGAPLDPEIMLSGTLLYNFKYGTDIAPVVKAIDITNTGDVGSILNWEETLTDLMGLAGRISASPVDGSLNDGISEICDVTVDPTGLIVGIYTGNFRVNDKYLADTLLNGTVAEKVLPVTVNVTPAYPVIVLSGGPLSYEFIVGDTGTLSINANIANAGDPLSVLNWAAAFSSVSAGIAGKLALGSASGAINVGNNVNDAVVVTKDSVVVGNYSAQLDVTETVLGGVTPQSLPVSVIVKDRFLGQMRSRWTDEYPLPFPPGTSNLYTNAVTAPSFGVDHGTYRTWSTAISGTNGCVLTVPNNGGQCTLTVNSPLGGINRLVTFNVTVAFSTNGAPVCSLHAWRYYFELQWPCFIEWAESF